MGSKVEENNNSNGKSNSKDNVRLQREIGLLEGVAIIIGSIIGSGIFISPKGVVESVGSVGLSLIVWGASGVISIVGAICFAELGTTLPGSGGDYHYLHEAFGPLLAFLYIWASILIFVPTGNVILALTFAKYVVQPFFPFGCQIPDLSIKLLAAAAILFLTFLNCFNVRATTSTMNVFMFTKISALVLIIVAGLYQLLTNEGGARNFENLFVDSNVDPGKLALGFYSGLWAYGGFTSLNFMTEELKTPNKNLPRAIYISLPIVILIYLLINVAYFSVLTPKDMIESDAVAVTFGDEVLGVFAWTMPVFISISSFGSLSISVLKSSRLLLVGARNGHFPSLLAHLNIERLTPQPSLVFCCLLSLCYLYTTDIYALINYSSFIHSISSLFVIAGMIYLRLKKPDLPRPIKYNIIWPVFYFLISLFLGVLPIYRKPIPFAIGAAITLSGLPVFYLAVVRKTPEVVEKLLGEFYCPCKLTLGIQKTFLSVEEESEGEKCK